MSILDQAKAAAEKAATEAAAALKSVGAKAADFAGDALPKRLAIWQTRLREPEVLP
jgi:hypothetical protein